MMSTVTAGEALLSMDCYASGALSEAAGQLPRRQSAPVQRCDGRRHTDVFSCVSAAQPAAVQKRCLSQGQSSFCAKNVSHVV